MSPHKLFSHKSSVVFDWNHGFQILDECATSDSVAAQTKISTNETTTVILLFLITIQQTHRKRVTFSKNETLWFSFQRQLRSAFPLPLYWTCDLPATQEYLQRIFQLQKLQKTNFCSNSQQLDENIEINHNRSTVWKIVSFPTRVESGSDVDPTISQHREKRLAMDIMHVAQAAVVPRYFNCPIFG